MGSTLLAVAAGALMPAGVQWVMVVAGTVVTAVLFTGRLERRSGMVLMRSRPLTDR